MQPPISPLGFAVFMFASMLFLLEVGHRLGLMRGLKELEADRSPLTAVDGAVFALLGLLMAFTFSGAASRFNEKRALVGVEANAIETAYLRIGAVPVESQPKLRQLFRQYLDSRLETYRKLPNLAAAEPEMARSKVIQDEIWSSAIAAINLPDARPFAGLLLPSALNNMIDMSTTRTVALYLHPPMIVYYLLFCASLIAALLVGYRMSTVRRSWLHILAFVAMTTIVVYVTLDVEYPRAGLFRLDDADTFLLQVRERMK